MALGPRGRRHQDPQIQAHPRPTARCVEALLDHRDRQATARQAAGERWVDNDLVFASATGTPLDSANVRRGFRRVAAAAGLDAADWTPRELRHSFVSVLSDAGVPIEQIARLVGHTSGSTVTETVYRQQLRPVIEDGATIMDHVFGRHRDRTSRRPATPRQPQRGGPTLQ